jgi:hypothetical protein
MLISCGFAEFMALVVGAVEGVGAGVDVDHLAVAPGAGVVLVSGVDVGDGVAVGGELGGDRSGEGFFELQLVGEILMVEAGGVGGLLDVEVVIQN